MPPKPIPNRSIALQNNTLVSSTKVDQNTDAVETNSEWNYVSFTGALAGLYEYLITGSKEEQRQGGWILAPRMPWNAELTIGPPSQRSRFVWRFTGETPNQHLQVDRSSQTTEWSTELSFIARLIAGWANLSPINFRFNYTTVHSFSDLMNMITRAFKHGVEKNAFRLHDPAGRTLTASQVLNAFESADPWRLTIEYDHRRPLRTRFVIASPNLRDVYFAEVLH